MQTYCAIEVMLLTFREKLRKGIHFLEFELKLINFISKKKMFVWNTMKMPMLNDFLNSICCQMWQVDFVEPRSLSLHARTFSK